MTDGLFAALESAGDYVTAGATADRIASLTSLTEDQWRRLDEIYQKNNQIHDGVLATRALAPFYEQNGREWPPRNQVPAPAPADPWATRGSAEPPF